jgi:hypothetical protein
MARWAEYRHVSIMFNIDGAALCILGEVWEMKTKGQLYAAFVIQVSVTAIAHTQLENSSSIIC